MAKAERDRKKAEYLLVAALEGNTALLRAMKSIRNPGYRSTNLPGTVVSFAHCFLLIFFCSIWGHWSSISARKTHVISWKVKLQPILRHKRSKKSTTHLALADELQPFPKQKY